MRWDDYYGCCCRYFIQHSELKSVSRPLPIFLYNRYIDIPAELSHLICSDEDLSQIGRLTKIL